MARAYEFGEQLLASQRKFAEDLLKAAAPLVPGRAESTPTTETYKPVASRRSWWNRRTRDRSGRLGD